MIVALETATEAGGVAVLDGAGDLRAERSLGPERPRYAAELMPALDAALRDAGSGLDSVALIALSVGPGSFTGLRVGLATALGLCFGSARRIVPVPTLAALSLHAGGAHRVPMLDARKGQVYTALYGPEACCELEERVVAPREWLRELAGRPGGLELLGPGAHLYRNEIASVLGARARILPAERGRPRAATVGRLGARLASSGAARAPEEVELRYLRPPDAVRGRGGHPPGRNP